MVIHDQDIANGEARLMADLGITTWLAASVALPVRLFSTSIRYLDSAGHDVAIANPDVHHHDETLFGSGDPWLMARTAMRSRGFLVGARIGVTVPLGRTEPDPFALGDLGRRHEHSQFGIGTFAPLAGVDVSRRLGPVTLDASALTIQSLYANSHGYQAGDRYAGSIGAGSGLGTKAWWFRTTLELQVERAETWGDTVHTDEGNTGRIDLLVGAEASWRVNDDWHLGVFAKFPAYTRVSGGQLDLTAFLGINVGTHLHLFEEDDHGHAHHDHADEPAADWTGLDHADATTSGQAVPLTPVPGKITVFDFWATWCEPCHVLDRELSEVARRHPGDIAVRKVNVIDTDSAAWMKYLAPGKFELPHLKVFGRDGTLLWERTAPPLNQASEVETTITGGARKAPVITGARRIAIDITETGFVPARVTVRAGEPVTLVFTRRTSKTCAVDVHFALPDGGRIDHNLPLDTPVLIPLRVERAGEVSYGCGMDMVRGTIVVQ